MVLGLVVCLSSRLVIAGDLEAVEKRIAGTWQQHKSMVANYERVVERHRGKVTVREISKGKLELLKVGETIMRRLDTVDTRIKKFGDTETTTPSENRISIDDGKNSYLYIRGMATAAKWIGGGKDDPRKRLDVLRKRYELKLLSKESAGGERGFVIEAIAIDQRRIMLGARILLHYREDGILVKELRYDKDGNLLSTQIVSDIRLDVDIDPARFVLSLPKGVPVKVLRKGQGMPMKKLPD